MAVIIGLNYFGAIRRIFHFLAFKSLFSLISKRFSNKQKAVATLESITELVRDVEISGCHNNNFTVNLCKAISKQNLIHHVLCFAVTPGALV